MPKSDAGAAPATGAKRTLRHNAVDGAANDPLIERRLGTLQLELGQIVIELRQRQILLRRFVIGAGLTLRRLVAPCIVLKSLFGHLTRRQMANTNTMPRRR